MSIVKNGAQIPTWVFYVVIGVVALGVIAFFVKSAGGDGPRDPSTYPKEAYSPPAYSGASGGNYGGYTKDGVPVK